MINEWMHKIKFDPTINLGHIISLVSFLSVAVVAWFNLTSAVEKHKLEADLRFATIEKTIVEQKLEKKEKDIEQDQNLNRLGMELKEQLRSNREELRQEFKDLRSDLRRR